MIEFSQRRNVVEVLVGMIDELSIADAISRNQFSYLILITAELRWNFVPFGWQRSLENLGRLT